MGTICGLSTCARHKFLFHTFYRFFLSEFYLTLMGTSGLEPPTSRLSGVRSNHLSYAPVSEFALANPDASEFDFEVNDFNFCFAKTVKHRSIFVCYLQILWCLVRPSLSLWWR